MLERKEVFQNPDTFDFSTFAPKHRVVFFDIETTGLKASNASLYLIGFVSFEEEGWTLTQYFAESPAEEKKVLEAFTDFLRERLKTEDHLILVSFNGDGFDIPYLKTVAAQYHLPDPFHGCISFDLYKEMKPYKRLAGLSNCKLKTIEKELLGIEREDRYSGGELISVYEEYVRMSMLSEGCSEDTAQNTNLRKEMLRCLLLHNGEDIKDMLSVMKIRSFQHLFDGGFHKETAEIVTFPRGGRGLDLCFRLEQGLPKELYFEEPELTLSVSGRDQTLFELVIPLVDTRMRYYYPNYKDYYYLPGEDEAIHKSVGDFVDRKNRKQATAQTCYTWKEGTFLPLPGPVPSRSNLFYPCFHGKAHTMISAEDLQDEAFIKELGIAALEHFRSLKTLPKI